MQDNRFAEIYDKVQLIARQIKGDTSPAEDAELADWLNQDPGRMRLYHELTDENTRQNALAELLQFDQEAAYTRFLSQTVPGSGHLSTFRWMGIAVSILVVVFAAALYVNRQGKAEDPLPAATVQSDIVPGGNKATLTLANGRTIDLSEEKNGIIIDAGAITYNDGTKLDELAKGGTALIYNSVSTPRGGQYQVVLPDGTRVWLNAATTLKYPSKFAPDRREIEIFGEAYLEIAADRRKPFSVTTEGQKIDVIGTAFNINSYRDELNVKTTVVEGAVKVSKLGKSIFLNAGEEAILSDQGHFDKQKADISAATAWKADRFYFKDTPLDAMMRQLSRWYNIDVLYDGGIPDEFFTGKMSRQLNLTEVLDFLEGSGVKFRLIGRKLTITNKL